MGYCQQENETEPPKNTPLPSDIQEKIKVHSTTTSVDSLKNCTNTGPSDIMSVITGNDVNMPVIEVPNETVSSDINVPLSPESGIYSNEEDCKLLIENSKYSKENVEKIKVETLYKSLTELKILKDEKEKENAIILKESIHEHSTKDFDLLKTLGKGAFGDVFLVRKKDGPDAGALYALKMIYKAKILEDEYYAIHFRSERNALEMVRDGIFLSTIFYAFQSPAHLFIVMDYNSGGQLLHQFIGKNVLFENHMRVYLAELLVAVDYLHNQGIIHRDIKPENVLLDSKGHAVLIDYGLSKVFSGGPNESHVGTEPYIAPEILLHKPHNRTADFWSLGVLGYEMVVGVPPFSLELTDEKLRKAVLEHEPVFSGKLFHKPCKALLTGLMQKNPKQRLGAVNKDGQGGINAIMGHKFFKMTKWADVSKRKLRPPNIPKEEDLSKCKPTTFKEASDTGYRNHFDKYDFSWLQQKEKNAS